MRPIARAALALTLLAAPAAAQDVAQDPSGPAAVVDARQSLMAAMQTLGTHIDLEAEAATGDAFYQLLEEADAIARLLHAVGPLFPDGTGPDDLQGVVTHAAPAVWTDRARFDALLAASRAAADAAVAAEDGPALFERFEALEATCTACHAEFLAYDPFQGLDGAPPADEAIFDFGGEEGSGG